MPVVAYATAAREKRRYGTQMTGAEPPRIGEE
jgi:hypothetical protein